MRCFSAEHSSLGIADISSSVGMTRSTTHRYVVTLVELGYLEQDPNRKYRLGLRVTDLGAAALAATGLAECAEPCLKQLRSDTNLTVGMALLDGDEIVYVERVRGFREGQYAVERDLDVGSRLPAYCTAMGKLLLAYLPPAEQRRLLDGMTLARRGPGTIVSKARLREELEGIRACGVAIENEERASGLQAAAVPVHASGGEVLAAVTLVAHGMSLTAQEIRDTYLVSLQRAASDISEAFAAGA